MVLTGCSDNPNSLVRQHELDEMRARTDRLVAKVYELQGRNAELEENLRGLRALALENSSNIQSIASAVNKNAAIANEKAVAEMTERGACGTRLVQIEGGGVWNRRIPCTEADLRRE
jgi:predicted  nucleic acid-binding Zn-ribbon protein